MTPLASPEVPQKSQGERRLRQKDRNTLTRRMAHLEERIAEGEKIGRRGLDYDRGELAALRRLLAERS